MILAAWILPCTALADPCDLIPERGPMPAEVRAGQVFSGPVVYVGDGDRLCVAVGEPMPSITRDVQSTKLNSKVDAGVHLASLLVASLATSRGVQGAR
jgi:hypothetical protein